MYNVIPKLNNLAEKIIICAVLILLSALVFGSFINISCGIEDLNMMFVFSNDEPENIKMLLKNLYANDINPRGFFTYGYLYQTTAYFILKLYSFFGYSIDKISFIAHTLRAISLFSFIGLLLLFERSLKMLDIDLVIRLIFTLFLASIPSLSFWSQMVHPDLLQTFLIFLSFYILLSEITFARIILSAIIAGLAFGTKYGGAFLLIFIFSAYFLNKTNQMTFNNYKKQFFIVFSGGICIFFFFVISWIISNPYVISNFDDYLTECAKLHAFIVRGYGYAEPTNPFLWFALINHQVSLGGSIILVVGMLLLVFSLAKNFIAEKQTAFCKRIRYFLSDKNRIIVLSVIIYSVIILLYLMLEMNARRPRYLFSLLPFLVMLSSYGISITVNKYGSAIRILSLILLVIPVVLLSIGTIEKNSAASRRYEHPRIKAGIWVKNHYPPSTRVMADTYSYLPQGYFKERYFLCGVNQERIKAFKPDLLIINKISSGRWSWKKPGTKFSDRNFVLGYSDNAKRIFDFHQQLFSKDSKWKIVYEKGDTVILEKKVGKHD